MSDSTEQAAVKNRLKKPSGNSHALLATPTVPTQTVFVGFPTPTTVNCPSPFHVLGTNDPTTTMSPTATIVTPAGTLTGTLLAQPDPPFTWTYEFTDPIPTGVPLAVVVRGTNAAGGVEEVVVPFQAQ